MRFYIDTQNDKFITHDDEGIELDSIREARLLMAKSIGGIIGDLVAEQTEGKLSVQVRTDSGSEPILWAMLTFQISGAIK